MAGVTAEERGGLAVDGVHLGLTHNDLLARLSDGLQKGRAGFRLHVGHTGQQEAFLASGTSTTSRPSLGIALPSQETRIRGVPLVHQ